MALLQPKERNPTLTSHQVHCKFFFHQTHSFNSTFHHEQFIRSTSCFSCYLWSAYVRYNENKNAGVALTNGLFTVAAAFSLANSYFILASCVLKKWHTRSCFRFYVSISLSVSWKWLKIYIHFSRCKWHGCSKDNMHYMKHRRNNTLWREFGGMPFL